MMAGRVKTESVIGVLGLVMSCSLATVPVSGDITVGGTRPVTVRVPASYDQNVPSPLLLLLHGFTGTGSGLESQARFAPLAESRGILYAHPQGTMNSSGITFWNATEACCGGVGSTVDDSGYLRSVIDETKSILNVDERRVYLVGWSNGGFMSYRMACDHADTIAAIVSFAGATFLDPARCTPSAPVHILQMHGTADTVIRYNGGVFRSFSPHPGAVATVEQWAGYDGCLLTGDASAPPIDLYPELAGTETSIVRYRSSCALGGSAELWTIANGSHTPPYSNVQAHGVITSRFALAAVDWLLDHPKRPVPRASLEVAPPAGPSPLTVAVDGSTSSTPEDTEILSYEWDFGDGGMAEGIAATHKYEGAGRYGVALTIRTTDEGRIDRATEVVTAFCSSEELPPWVSSDVGDPVFRGGVRKERGDGPAQQFELCAGGRDIGSRADEFFFLHQEASGDVAITARLSEITGGNISSVSGVMIRGGLEKDAAFGAMLVQTEISGLRFRFRSRSSAGEIARNASGNEIDPGAHVWVRVERQGDTFRGWSSVDRESWSLVAEREIPGLPETLRVGIAAAARDASPDDINFTPLRARVSEIELGEVKSAPRMLRGDCNDDGTVDISDAIFTLGSLFLGVGNPDCDDACDSNDDGAVDISDAISTLGVLFLGQGVIPLPGMMECGVDPTEDEVECAEYNGCK